MIQGIDLLEAGEEPEFGKWMPCDRMLPEWETDVICLFKEECSPTVRILQRVNWDEPYAWTDWDTPRVDDDQVSHWMPCPGGVLK